MKKIIVITGTSSGIGKETAIGLAKLGHKLILINRDSHKSKESLTDIICESQNKEISMIFADLSNKDEIKSATDKISLSVDRVDVLINNAGLFNSELELNSVGIEMNIAVNYLAPKYMSENLLPLLKISEQGRIINVSSMVHKKGKEIKDVLIPPKKYRGFQQYANSKLAVVNYTKELAETLKDTNITVNSVHPGVIASEVFRDYPTWLNKLLYKILPNAQDGAKPSINLATNSELANISGAYFNKNKQE
ncbi:MAG: SDR family NAD(P)-dependent oxidoreductase [Spirochaetaceae bacterium]